MAQIIVKLKHDDGSKTLKLWAENLEAAKLQVLKSENCPKSAIKSIKFVKPTIYDIKRLTAETSPYYFSNNTMKHFNQTLRDFKVYRNGDKFLIQAKHKHGVSQRLFNPITNKLEFVN